MLIVFNLDWERFHIDRQVSAANRKLNGLAAEKGSGTFITFNLASLGAGEWINNLHTPESEHPESRTLDYLRRRHWRILRDIRKDDGFKANRDASEMLSTLKARGHVLAATFTGAGGDVNQKLKNARVIDFFEADVFSYDSLPARNRDLTSISLYRYAMRVKGTPPSETIIVADNPEGIEEGRHLNPVAVAGYVDPYLDDKVIDARLKEMQSAGAHFAVVGGHSVSYLPDFLLGRRALKSTLDAAMKRFGP